MFHPKLQELEPEERQETTPTIMQQYAAYNHQQWKYYNELIAKVYHGNYGDNYNFLIAELMEGPYWPSIKARLGQIQEQYNPEASVCGSREPLPEDDSSSSSDSSDSDDWEYVNNILAAKSA